MAFRDDKIQDGWSATGVGTTAGVTVTKTGASGQTQMVTGIQVSGDATATVTVESPASTILWRQVFSAAFTPTSFSFAQGALNGASGSDVLVKISASSARCEANIQGYTI